MRNLGILSTAAAAAVTLAVSGGTQARAGGCGGCGNHPASKDIVQTATSAGKFETLTAALQAAGLLEVLRGEGPFTVLAPTDEAFAKLPEGTVANLLRPENRDRLQAILKYHVVSGALTAKAVTSRSGAVTLNGQRLHVRVDGSSVHIGEATVKAADIEASNGVIHVIDRVLLPVEQDLTEVVSGAGKFGTLLAAAEAAGLVETLRGDGPFTVFAPTDEAFSKLPAGTVESLLEPRNRGQLVSVLTYHVVPGRIYAEQALEAGKAATVQGAKLELAIRDGVATVQDARILATDLDASNGVIHVIDRVILPPALQG